MDAMPNTDAQRAKDYRDRQRGAPPRELEPCGTLAAHRRHKRNGEPIDDACRDTYNAEHRRLYAARQERAANARARAARAAGRAKKGRRRTRQA